nr:tRNA pseudouridine(38-40) synthase TruA [Bacillus pacificus]
GAGKFSAADVKGMLDTKDREAAGRTAPGHGLYLWHVYYDN